jgi:hypothetical protein
MMRNAATRTTIEPSMAVAVHITPERMSREEIDERTPRLRVDAGGRRRAGLTMADRGAPN